MATNTDDSGHLELEAMRKEDCSWHPCQVHFSPDDAALIIKYGNNNGSQQDTLVSEKEALMRIRVRSLPLQDDDCVHVKPGELVVASQNSQPEGGGFFDAEVEKVLRVRHSKRAQCRCSFLIKWLHQDGSITVPSSSVMRLANKSINDHPEISAFMDEMLLINSSFSSMSPQLTAVNAIDLELHDLLEKQIEGIRNSVHSSKKKIRDEILGLEANTNEQAEETDISAPDVKEPETEISTDTTRSRRSNRSKEEPRRADVENPPSPVIPSPSTEELPDNKSPLNPLAARAALASMMSKLPQSLETSLDEEAKNGLTDFSEGKALKSYSSSGIDDFFDKFSSEAEVTTKPSRVVKKPLFSGHSKAEESDFSTNITQVTENKTNTEIRTRSTRATVKKVNGIPDDNSDGKKLSITTNRRLTRSALGKEGETVTIETVSVVEKHMPSRCEEYITSDNKVTADDGSQTSKKHLLKTEEGNKGIKIAGSTCTARRLTRSMLNKEAENIKPETAKESSDDGFPRNDGILDAKKTKAVSSPFSADISVSPAEGNKKRVISGGAKSSEKTDSKSIDVSVDLLTERSNKKRNTSGGASVTQDSEGDVTSEGGRSYGSKKKPLGLKNQKVRSSPRFLSKS